MELNFNKVQKHYLKITLFNETTPILVGTPNKRLLDKLLAMDTVIDNSGESELNTEQVTELYNICAEVLSINKTNKKITGEQLEEMFDIEDLFLFFNKYMEFIDSIATLKN